MNINKLLSNKNIFSLTLIYLEKYKYFLIQIICYLYIYPNIVLYIFKKKYTIIPRAILNFYVLFSKIKVFPLPEYMF